MSWTCSGGATIFVLSFIEIHIAVSELQPDKKVAGTRIIIIIIIITRRLQLQATVKRFLSDPDNDLDIDLAKYYGLTSLHNQYLLNYKLKDRALQFLDHNDLINTMYPLALVIKNVALDHSYT